MAGHLIYLIGLPSHTPIKPRAEAPTKMQTPRHLSGRFEGLDEQYSNLLTYTCKCVSYTMYIAGGFRTDLKAGSWEE